MLLCIFKFFSSLRETRTHRLAKCVRCKHVFVYFCLCKDSHWVPWALEVTLGGQSNFGSCRLCGAPGWFSCSRCARLVFSGIFLVSGGFSGLSSGCVYLISRSHCTSSLCFLISHMELLLPKVQSMKPTSGAGGWHLNPYFTDGQSLLLGVQCHLLHEDLDA